MWAEDRTYLSVKIFVTCLLLCASCTHLCSDARLQVTPKFTQSLLLLFCASRYNALFVCHQEINISKCLCAVREQSPFVLKASNLLLEPKMKTTQTCLLADGGSRPSEKITSLTAYIRNDLVWHRSEPASLPPSWLNWHLSFSWSSEVVLTAADKSIITD